MPKIGLEIHQRLNTGKLFCNCNFNNSNNTASVEYVKKAKRKLHAVESEMYELDAATAHEAEKDFDFFYSIPESSSCLIELDEEPPFEINKEALETAIAIGLKLNIDIADKIQVMRKIVIDGSNTSGFQRTALVGINGSLDARHCSINLQTLCLEEESASVLDADEDSREKNYGLERMGIPLIEIATAPDIKSGKEAMEIAKELGMLLRMTGKSMRGIGTIRQDLNVSTEKGARVEIKGAQELYMIETWIENEIKRQNNVVEIIEELKSRNAFAFLEFKIYDVSEACISGFSKSAVMKGQKALALPLIHHKGILGREISPERRYGTELSDYAKKANVKGMIHSDENLDKYGIDGKKVDFLLGLKENDAFAIIIADQETAEKALRYAFERASMDYIPKEVRKTLKNGSTAFMRPLSGKARLYPETDVPFINVANHMETAKANVPKLYSEALAEIEAELKNPDIAEKLVSSPNYIYYKELAKICDSKFVALLLTDIFNEALGKKGQDTIIEEEKLFKIFMEIAVLFEKGKITQKGARILFAEMLNGSTASSAIARHNLQKIAKEGLLKIAGEYNYNFNSIMKSFALQIEAEELREIVEKKRNEK